MITIPTRNELRRQLQAFLGVLVPGIKTGKDTDAGARIEMMVDALYGQFYEVSQIQKDIWPQTASAEGLAIHAETRLGPSPQLPAAGASGTEALRVTGESGVVVASGLTLVDDDGNQYRTTTAGTLAGSPPTVDLSVEATSTGIATNRVIDDVLQFDDPPDGVDTDATLIADLTGGRDNETPAELLERVLHAIRNPPAGGRFADYWAWARGVAGVAQAYIYGPSSQAQTGRRGLGVVDVAVLQDGSGADRVPTAALVQDVQDAIDAVRPGTTSDTLVLTPDDVAQDLDVRITAEYGFEFEWTGTGTVSSYTKPTITWTATLPATLAVDDRIYVNGEVHQVKNINSGNKTTELYTDENGDVFATGNNPSNGMTIYPGGPLSQPIKAALIALCDSLGPARGVAADPEQRWEDVLRLSDIYAACMAVPGVRDCIVATPNANVTPDDNAPSGTVELIIYDQITVRPA